LLNQVILDCRQDFAQCTNSEFQATLQKVAEFATSELKKCNEGGTLILDRLFHFTDTVDATVSILLSGIQVAHEKLYKGAFVSTHPELSFGKFGVTAASFQLISKDHARIERRDVEDNGAVWIGATHPIPVLADRVLYSAQGASQLPELRAALLNANKPHCELISAEVYSVFLRYIRKQGWAVPVPANTTPTRLKTRSRGAQV
jgi:hypothetical protein